MSVFTIFCHGTGEHRDKNKENEIIHDLSDLILGTEYQDFLILDGPGAGEIMPGTYDPFSASKHSKTSAPQWSQTDNRILDMAGWRNSQSASAWSEDSHTTFNNVRSSLKSSGHGFIGRIIKPFGGLVRSKLDNDHEVRGNVYGEGMDDNIRHAIASISEVWNGDLNGKTINLIGWSRGAITCIRIANWIKEFYGSGPDIHIFAIDPVAGNDLGFESEDTYIIPDIVKKFVGIIVQDDKRGGFLPQDINRLQPQSQQNEFVLLPFPGSHDTPCRATKSTEYSDVPHITRYLAYHFLNDNGTQFKCPDKYSSFSPVNLSSMYANIKLKSSGYSMLGKAGLVKAAMGGITQRAISGELDRYISHNTEFFVNEHHVECFKKAHTAMHNIFFKPQLAPRPTSTATVAPPPRAGRQRSAAVFGKSPVQIQLDIFDKSDRNSYDLLRKLGAIMEHPSGAIPNYGHLAKPGNGAMASGRSLLQDLIK